MAIELDRDQSRAFNNINHILPTPLRAKDVETWTIGEVREAEDWYYSRLNGMTIFGAKVLHRDQVDVNSTPALVREAFLAAERAETVEIAAAARTFIAASRFHDKATSDLNEAGRRLARLRAGRIRETMVCDGVIIRWVDDLGYVVERPHPVG